MYLTQAVPLRGFGPPRRHGWWWLALAGAGQPLAMEAYNLAHWFDPDPAWVRMVTLTGPLIISGLAAAAILREREDWWTWLWVPAVGATALGFAWVEDNWAYRSAFLALQLVVVAMWWRALRVRTAWLVELWAKRVGLGFAVLGVHLCVLVQFAFAETPFLGTMPAYDPSFESSSAEVQAGLAATVWAMPLGSALAIAGLTMADRWRRARRRRRRLLRF